MFPIHDDHYLRRPARVTLVLVVAWVATFLYQLILTDSAMSRLVHGFGAIPVVLLDRASLPPGWALTHPWATPFTALFLHWDLAHLAGSVLCLWVFGSSVEHAMGPVRFLSFCVLGALGALVAYVAAFPTSYTPLIGAGGLVSAGLGAYLLLYPRARVLVLSPFLIFPRPRYARAWWVLGGWLLLQIGYIAWRGPGGGGGVWVAHLGGFVAGCALVPLCKLPGVRLLAPARSRSSALPGRRRERRWGRRA